MADTGYPHPGPSWISPEDWADRLVVYRRQGRSDTDVAELATYLEKRGPRQPRTSVEQIARAQDLDLVARAEYMNANDEAHALKPGPDGLPHAWLERVRDRLLVVTPLGWVNPKSRTAHRAGLHSFLIAGSRYQATATTAGRITPGTSVQLIRERDNQHDCNAIAVHAETGHDKLGYVPKTHAKRLARLLDTGDDLVAITVRDSAAGTDSTTPHLLVCERRLYNHLTRLPTSK